MNNRNQESNDNLNISSRYAVLLILFIATIPYLNTFNSPFVFDDIRNIAENHWLKITSISFENLFQAATNSPSKNRPLPNISFALNYYFGGLNVWGYHLVNLIVHLSASVTLFFLMRFTLTTPQIATKCKRPQEIALFAALLWAVHPLQTNAVTYLVQRMTSMAALFYLLSLFFFIKGYVSEENQKNKYIYYTSAFISAIMAFLCKENTAILPFVLFAYFLFFLKPNDQRLDYKKYIVPISSALVVLLLALVYIGGNPLTHILGGYEGRTFTLTERLLTESRIIFHYITLIILPLPSRLNLTYNYPISSSIFSPPQTLLAIAGIVLLVYAIKYFYNRDRFTSFAIFWFLVNLAIESTVIPLELIYEHRLYLPSTFVILSIVSWVYRIPANNVKLIRGIMIFTIILLSFFTWQRNTVWKSETSMWADVVKKSPFLSRGYNNLGKALNLEKEYIKAEKALLKSIELDPNDVGAYINLARTYEKTGRLRESYTTFQKALTKNKKHGDDAKIYYNMGIIHLKQKNTPQAIELLSKAFQANPYTVDITHNLGVAYGMMGLHQKAEQFFLKSIELDPDNGHIFLQLAVSYEYQERYQEAINILEKSLTKTNVDYSTIHREIERIKKKNYYQTNKFKKPLTN